MQTFRHEDLDGDILSDLLEEINELYEASEQTLIELELRPEDNELQRSLFRSIHTIKGDLGLVSFTPMIPLLQHVEDLLDFLRNGEINYTSTMSDLVLLTLDKVKLFVESCSKSGEAEYDDIMFDKLVTHIALINPNNASEHEKLLAESVLLLDPSLDSRTAEEVQEEIQSKTQEELNRIGIPEGLSEEKQADIMFFKQLMEPIEERSMYWKGRGDRIAKLALLLNRLAGSPIDNDQLAVACYVHDFGMAFMPLKVLHKQGDLDANEFNLMRSHVYKSSRLLEHLDQWNDARKMVMQHHERLDGSGYPLGVKDADICDGARLIAILDTYDALTHTRAHNSHRKRPKKRAVVEINRVAEGQFCPKWMKIFNRAMASLLKKERQE
ncbi:HD domain-containing protein [Alteromonadaceae bacterium M269]|nr:HD domain-containing protein [Alteromonadaceae bacterium M269]